MFQSLSKIIAANTQFISLLKWWLGVPTDKREDCKGEIWEKRWALSCHSGYMLMLMLGVFLGGLLFSGRDSLTYFYLKVTVERDRAHYCSKITQQCFQSRESGAGRSSCSAVPPQKSPWGVPLVLSCSPGAEAGAGFDTAPAQHSQAGVYSSKRWMTASTAESSSIRKAVWRLPALPRMVQTRTQMRRRKHWRTSWGKWSLSWPRPSCSLWRRNVKYR